MPGCLIRSLIGGYILNKVISDTALEAANPSSDGSKGSIGRRNSHQLT